MKIAYLGKVQLSDADLSYLHSAQKRYDMTYLLEVNPRFMKGPAMNIKKVYPHTGIFKALDAYPEFGKYAGLIDMDKFYVVNTSVRHKSDFTTQVLYRLGYHWPYTSWDYVERFVKAIDGFGFFEE